MTNDTRSDRSGITDLLGRIAHLADDGELADYIELFTEDAVWAMPANPAVGASGDRRVGREDILAGARARRESGLQGPGTATRHVITTVEVVSCSDDEARTVAYWLFVRNTTATPQIASMGRYDDVLRYTAEGWRLAERQITVG